MTNVTFYLIPEEHEHARQRLSCQLASQFCLRLIPTHIHAAKPEYAAQLDELLWEYPPNRFVPHIMANERSNQCLVTVSHEKVFSGNGGALINTTQKIPEMVGLFDEVCELVLANERPRARDQYKEYRSRQFDLRHKELDQWE